MNSKRLLKYLNRRRKMANEFFESIKTSLNQAIDYEKGNKSAARSTTIIVSDIPEYKGSQVKSIRENLGLTQRTFAYVVGVSQKTVEAWEANRNIPQGPAQRFLALMDKGGRDFLSQYNLITL